MDVKALITFGCSWPKGKGSFSPSEGMAEDNFFSTMSDELDEKYSFRNILSKRHGYKNINYSFGGSANASSIRLAEEYFNTDDYKKYDEVIVLWGITSTSRGEFWRPKDNKWGTVAYSIKHNQKKIGDYIREKHYDHNAEVQRLSTQINHWDNYFNIIGVKNYWFDTFNHHDYSYKSPNMIWGDDNPKDILSKLCGEYSDNKYHHSMWTRDSGRINFLLNNNLVNPYTLHPNIQCHIMIADMIDKFILW